MSRRLSDAAASPDAPVQLSLFEPVAAAPAPPTSDPAADDPAQPHGGGNAAAVAQDEAPRVGAERRRQHAATSAGWAAPRPRPHRPQATTLRAAIDEYREYLIAANSSKHTRDSFGLDLRLLLDYLGDVPLTQIGERELRSFIAHVRMQRHNAPTSIRRKVATMKNFFSYLHRERAIASDPSLRLIYPEIYPVLPEFLDEARVAALLEAASEHHSWLALISLLIETGLKRDEVVALGRADVNLAPDPDYSSYLVVRETEQAKRVRSRRLEIGPAVADLLRVYLAGEPERPRFFDFSPRGVNFIVETCGKRARIVTRGPKLTPQVLRETFAVRQMRAMMTDEDRLRLAGEPEEALLLVIERHDIQLLRMLGLHEEPESAKKYRKLAHGWTHFAHP